MLYSTLGLIVILISLAEYLSVGMFIHYWYVYMSLCFDVVDCIYIINTIIK